VQRLPADAIVRADAADYGRCIPNGSYVGPRCLPCHEQSLRAWVRREWGENEDDWLDEAEIQMQEEHQTSESLGAANIVGEGIKG